MVRGTGTQYKLVPVEQVPPPPTVKDVPATLNNSVADGKVVITPHITNLCATSSDVRIGWGDGTVDTFEETNTGLLRALR